MISESIIDMRAPVGEITYRTKDETLKVEKTKTYLEETLPKHLKMLESKVQGKYFQGEKATYIDVQLFAAVALITETFANVDLSAYPKLVAVADLVKQNPGVAAYLASQG